mmetsp:Transcript_25673/g.68168  ORF Transcript_25673/g.68168 Transcript_25673/m.68168 type:complete len:589 (-) Transcript_25673:97-1863(-)
MKMSTAAVLRALAMLPGTLALTLSAVSKVTPMQQGLAYDDSASFATAAATEPWSMLEFSSKPAVLRTNVSGAVKLLDGWMEASTDASLSLMLVSGGSGLAPDVRTACGDEPPKQAYVWMVVISILILFATVFVGAMCFNKPEPPAGENTLLDTSPMPLENACALHWGNVASFCCAVNNNIVLPGSVQDFGEVGGSLGGAGLRIGLWGAGAIFSLPLFLMFPVHKCSMALKMQALFVVIGNCIMIYGLFQQTASWLLIGRFITGLEGGIKFTLDYMSLYLTPPGDARSTALYNTRIATSVGNAFGMITQTVLWLFFANIIPQSLVVSRFPSEGVAHATFPLIFMSMFGMVYFLGVTFMFKEPIPYTDSPKTNRSRNVSPWAGILATCGCQYARCMTNQVLKCGVVLLMSLDFCMGSHAGLVLFAFQVSVVFSRSIAKGLLDRVGDEAKLMRILEVAEIGSLVLLFRLFGVSSLGLFMYLIGLAVFFNANTAVAVINISIGAESTDEDSIFTSKKALAVYVFVMQMLAWLLGPVVSFGMVSRSMGQNACASLATALTVCQVMLTYSFIQPKSEKHDKDVQPALPMQAERA